MNPTTPQPLPPSPFINGQADTSVAPPLVICSDTLRGHRYYMAGRGYVAERIAEASAIPIPYPGSQLHIDSPAPGVYSIHCLAPFQVISADDQTLHLRWGGEEFHFPHATFFSEAFHTLLPRVQHLRRFGGPFGPVVNILQGSQNIGKIAHLNVTFPLPPDCEELLLPLPLCDEIGPREIQARLPMLGLQKCPRLDQHPTAWHRTLGEGDLVLLTGGGSHPTSLTLHLPDGQALSVQFGQADSFRQIHQHLSDLITCAKAPDVPPVEQVFASVFHDAVKRSKWVPTIVRTVIPAMSTHEPKVI